MDSFEQLLNSHPAAMRARGLEYQQLNRVLVVERVHEGVTAVVSGTREYTVELKRGSRGWKGSCTCIAHADRAQCKHVCALLYELVASDEPTLRSPELAPEKSATERFGAPKVNKLLGHLLANSSLSQSLKRQLLSELVDDAEEPSAARVVEPDARRAARLIDVLASHPTFERAEQPSLSLRYVLSANYPEALGIGIEVQSAKIAARGGVGGYRTLKSLPDEAELDEIDRAACSVFIHGLHAQATLYSSWNRPAKFALHAALQRLLLPGLARAGRLHHAEGDDVPSSAPLAFDDGAPWRLRVDVTSAPESFEIEFSLERGTERVPLADVAEVLDGGFAITANRFVRVDWFGGYAWARTVRGEPKLRIGRDRASDVARMLSRAPARMSVHAQGIVEESSAPARPVLTFDAPSGDESELEGRIEFEYGAERVRRDNRSVIVKGERILRIRRDAEAESRADAQFVAAGGSLRAHSRESIDGSVERKLLGPLVHALTQQGWLVEGEGVKLRTHSAFQLSVESGVDWFDVEGQVRFDDVKVEFPALLEALAKRRTVVRLSDESFGVIPENWLTQWSSLAALGDVEGGKLRVKNARAFLLDTLLAERADVRTDAGFKALRKRLVRARDPRPIREPPGFVGELRPYQRAGLGWLQFHCESGMGGCLADDMGLGKTVQMLALLLARHSRARGPALVVAPKTLLFNWEREAQRFAPKLEVLVHHGSVRARRENKLEDADIVLTTYGTLRQDAKLLGEIQFDVVVLDEAQAIKNPKSQSAKAARALKADQRFALTGTPIENRVEDLLSIFEFLNPGLLEGSRALRDLLDASDQVETVRLAARSLGPFILRRTKEAVLSELPAKSEQIVSCELEGTQRREYDSLRNHYRHVLLGKIDGDGMGSESMHVLAALLRLRQAACHLALIDPAHSRTSSAKLETLMEMLEELHESGHKALVFSQFTSFLALVKPELEARRIRYEYLDGETQDREAVVERFQADANMGVFLVSLKAGGVGLNLTAADYVFLLDPWWNPAIERQAIDRTHRIGQTRPVTAYRLVARDTVEEKVLALQEEKRALADALFAGAGRALRELTRDDLEAILS